MEETQSCAVGTAAALKVVQHQNEGHDVAEAPAERTMSENERDMLPGGSLPCVRGEQVNLIQQQTVITGDQINIQTLNMGNQVEQGIVQPFDIEVCKQELITFYKHEMSRVQLLPWCDETRDMDDIYVSLELEQKTRDGTTMLAKNEDLVTLQTSQNIPATRVLVKALAGSGKTTLLTNLAYTWSQQKSDSPLAKVDLVFVLSLREVHRGCSLIDAIFQQLLADDTKISKNSLKIFIESHPSKVLILLDGFDEYEAKDLSSQEGNIERILIFKELRDCRIILSTRPYEHLGRHQSHYISVKLTGFSPANVKLYMTKFFCGDTEMVEGLSRRLRETEMLTSLSTIPVMLMLMCLLWEDDQNLPNTQSELYQQFTLFLWRKYCVKHGKYVNFDEEDETLKGEFSKTISKVGRVALDGTFPKKNITEEKLVFSEKDFGELFQLGCQTGLLTRERLKSKLNRCSPVTFLHKSFQEFCAAKFLASTDSHQFNCILKQIQPWDVLMSKIEVIKFCCGLADRDKVISIIQHAISIYGKMLYKLPKYINSDDILPILTMLYESQITNDDNLTLSLKSLISVDKLYVKNSHPQTLPIMCYFVKSAFGLSTLATINSVTFMDYPYDSLDVITDALICMPDVQRVGFHFKLDDTCDANGNHANAMCVTMAALSKLTHIRLYGSIDISVLLHHLSILSPNSCRVEHITFTDVVFNPTHMVQCLSNLNHLESLELYKCTHMDHPSMESILDAIHSQIKTLKLYDIHVSEAIGHIRHIIPHLQTLGLQNAKLKEDHIKTLCEFLPTASKLQELNLTCNTVGMASVPLAQQLQHCTKLERLELYDVHMTDQGIIELAERFAYLSNLKRLKVNRNNIKNTGLDAVFRHIHHLTKLKFFQISASVNNQCSILVRDCLAAIGKSIHDEAELIKISDNGSMDQIRSIISAANKHMKS